MCQCRARAAQDIEGHHRPVIASLFHPLFLFYTLMVPISGPFPPGCKAQGERLPLPEQESRKEKFPLTSQSQKRKKKDPNKSKKSQERADPAPKERQPPSPLAQQRKDPTRHQEKKATSPRDKARIPPFFSILPASPTLQQKKSPQSQKNKIKWKSYTLQKAQSVASESRKTTPTNPVPNPLFKTLAG